MTPVVYDEAVVNDNRFEAFLLPLLIPVAILGLADGVTDGDALEGEVGNRCLKVFFGEE